MYESDARRHVRKIHDNMKPLKRKKTRFEVWREHFFTAAFQQTVKLAILGLVGVVAIVVKVHF